MNDTGNASAPPNPMGTDGFEFIEYTAPNPELLGELFEQMGFSAVARHRSKDVVLYRQGRVNFIVNREADSFAQSFARVHGPSVCAFAMRVKNAAKAYQRAIDLGAKPHQGTVGPMELNIPAIQGIGGSLIYLIDRYPGGGGGNLSIYDVDFIPIEGRDLHPRGAGLVEVDHLTHNVYSGRMDTWARFYQKLFNFREIRYFDIQGKKTGLTSRALTLRRPSASTWNDTRIRAAPATIGGMPRSSKRASERQSATSSRSPCTTCSASAVWPSLKVVKSCARAVGMVALRGTMRSTRPPIVSSPSESGITSSSSNCAPPALPAS